MVTFGAVIMAANVNFIGVYMIKKMANTFITAIESLNKKDDEVSQKHKELMFNVQAVIYWFFTLITLFQIGVDILTRR